MKKKIMPFIKYCKLLYHLYYYLGTGFLNFLKLFVKTEDKLILFNSFGGQKFDDSPRVIYQAMIQSPDFAGYDFVWAFLEPERFDIPVGRKIKADTFGYFLTALKARCWITNSSLERGLRFTGKHTFFLNTWHGTPIKKMGRDIKADNQSFVSKNTWNMDVMTAQSRYEAETFTHAFDLPRDVCQVCGLARNDILNRADEAMQKQCRQELGIGEEKKVILYAPTFREYQKKENMQCILQLPVDFGVWKEKLGDTYIVLLRAHYEAVQNMDIEQYKGFVVDVTRHPSLNTLMIASDILISDYSSILFDYAILNRPMLCFAYDYDKYEESRGMYFDVRKWLPGGTITQEALLELITGLRNEAAYQQAVEKTRAFRNSFVEVYGMATENAIELIKKGMRAQNASRNSRCKQ